MSRRHSALLAVFVVSGLSTWAGLAGASAAPAERAPQLVSRHVAPDSIAALLEPTATVRVDVDWQATIAARLDALAAEPRTPTQDASDPLLEARVRAAVRKLGRRARVGVEIRDLDRNVTLTSIAADRPLNPASNQKLITAIAAVELLGAEYRFETTVSRAGDALILRGEGDPDLHRSDLHRLAAEVLARGQLDGVTRIIVDDGAFDSRSLGPGFRSDGPGDSYIAPSGALAIEFATVEITVRPGGFQQPPIVEVEPAGAAIELRNNAITGAGSLSVTTRAGEHGRTVVEIGGSIPEGHAPVTRRRRAHDPGLLAGSVFAELLAAQAGTTPLAVVRAPVPDAAEVVATHASAPLIAVLASALRYSNNFTAEQVLRTLAWRASGRPGSWADGVATLDRFAEAVSPERADAQVFVNGSGLALDGRLSPSFVNDVVALAQRPSSAAQMLLASFAKAGGEGTLHHRLSSAGARVLAKTGTYAGASSLSGIVTDEDGRRLGFSILVNGGSADRSRSAQDRIVAALLR